MTAYVEKRLKENTNTKFVVVQNQNIYLYTNANIRSNVLVYLSHTISELSYALVDLK